MSYSVIVAEDEPLLLNSLMEKIENSNLGFEVIGSAQTGIQAYELIENNNPDLLITDIRMPAMDGLKLIKKVYDNYPDIDCIIVTGYSDFTYAQTAIHYKVKEYLLKPIEDKKLYEVLSTIKNEYLMNETEYSKIFNKDLASKNPSEIAMVIKEYINAHYNEDIKVNTIASSMNYSPSYLTKIFCQQYSYSPVKYLIMVRINKAKQLLRHNLDLNIRQIGEAVGYTEQGYFSRAFKKFTGVSPVEYRDNPD